MRPSTCDGHRLIGQDVFAALISFSPMILIVIGRRDFGGNRSPRRLMPRRTRGRRIEVATGSGIPAS